MALPQQALCAVKHYRNEHEQRDTVVKSALMHTEEELLFCHSKDGVGILPRYQEYTDKSGLDPDPEDRTMTTVHYQAPAGCQFC